MCGYMMFLNIYKAISEGRTPVTAMSRSWVIGEDLFCALKGYEPELAIGVANSRVVAAYELKGLELKGTRYDLVLGEPHPDFQWLVGLKSPITFGRAHQWPVQFHALDGSGKITGKNL